MTIQRATPGPTLAARYPPAAPTASRMMTGMNSTFTCVRVVTTVCSPSIISLRGRVMTPILSRTRSRGSDMSDVTSTDGCAVDHESSEVVDVLGPSLQRRAVRHRDADVRAEGHAAPQVRLAD